VRIAGSGTVGWGSQSTQPGNGVFFRHQITNATFGGAPATTRDD
jgi:hypothetical protein